MGRSRHRKFIRRWRSLPQFVLGGAGGGALVDQWNAADKEAAVTLITPYLATIAIDASGDDLVRGTYGRASGLTYNEFEIAKPSGFGSFDLGFGVAAADMPFTNYLGQDLKGVSLWTSGDTLFNNGSGLGSFAGLAMDAAVTRYAQAINWTTMRIWWKNITRNSDWNGSALANPATGVGGLDISSLDGALFYLCGDLEKANHSIKMITGQEAYLGTVPAGFGYWRTV